MIAILMGAVGAAAGTAAADHPYFVRAPEPRRFIGAAVGLAAGLLIQMVLVDNVKVWRDLDSKIDRDITRPYLWENVQKIEKKIDPSWHLPRGLLTNERRDDGKPHL